MLGLKEVVDVFFGTLQMISAPLWMSVPLSLPIIAAVAVASTPRRCLIDQLLVEASIYDEPSSVVSGGSSRVGGARQNMWFRSLASAVISCLRKSGGGGGGDDHVLRRYMMTK